MQFSRPKSWMFILGCHGNRERERVSLFRDRPFNFRGQRQADRPQKTFRQESHISRATCRKEKMEAPFFVLFLMGLFVVSATNFGVERKGRHPGDTVRVCSYLCMMSQCPDSCRIFVGMKWSRRRSLGSLLKIPKIQFIAVARSAAAATGRTNHRKPNLT